MTNLTRHKEKPPIDWDGELVDSDGGKHRLLEKSALEAVTRLQGSFAFGIWRVGTGECVKSGCLDMSIGNPDA